MPNPFGGAIAAGVLAAQAAEAEGEGQARLATTAALISAQFALGV